MDPITRALLKYEKHLKAGGEPASLTRFPRPPHKPERLLNANAQCLCDRQAAYHIMADLGEIEPDIPESDGLLLDYRVGSLFEDHIAQALEHAGLLVEYQTRISAGKRKGRLDLLVQNGSGYWLVEIKTVKSSDGSLLDAKFPKPYHIAQADWYARNYPSQPRAMIFYALRPTFETRLYTWDWKGQDAEIMAWDPIFESWFYKTTLPGLRQEIAESNLNQERWLETGELPPRCGETPDEHPFLCVSKDWKAGTATPNCPYYGRCWEMGLDPFRISRKK